MPKEWFILINSNKEGPYNIIELQHDTRINPDTLVWKVGMADWTAARLVPELKDLFTKDEESDDQTDDIEEAHKKTGRQGSVDEILAIQNSSPPLFIWIIIALLIILYAFYQLSIANK